MPVGMHPEHAILNPMETSLSPCWNADPHGSYGLHCPSPMGGEAHVWIQGRRPYCDRGHWEWGNMGLPMQEMRKDQPSYYFMHLDVALAEVESWLGRHGLAPPSPSTHTAPEERAFRLEGPDGVLSSAWSQVDGATWKAQVGTQAAPVVATLEEQPSPKGPVFVLSVSGIDTLDDSDAFPRTYLQADHAQKEAEAFLAWRLLRQPAAVPGPIQLPPRPLGGPVPTAPSPTPVRRVGPR